MKVMTLEQLRSLRDRALEAQKQWKVNPDSALNEHTRLIRVGAFAQACINYVEEVLKDGKP